MDGVILTKLKQINDDKGAVFHAMKKSDKGFSGFGEAYFSTVNKDDIKGWKKHTQMTLNLVVPIGEIEFVVCDRESEEFYTIRLSQTNYHRLTVKPGLWVGFKGIGDYNVLLNIASIEHDPSESVNIDLKKIIYDW